MEKLKLLDIASILYALDNVLVLLMGLLYLISGTFQPYHIEFTGLTATDVTAFNANLMILIGLSIRMIGVGNLSGGLAGLFITIIPYRKGKKWAWFAVLITGMVTIVPTLIITNVVLGSHYLYMVFIVAMIIWIISMVLSTYEIFFRK